MKFSVLKIKWDPLSISLWSWFTFCWNEPENESVRSTKHDGFKEISHFDPIIIKILISNDWITIRFSLCIAFWLLLKLMIHNFEMNRDFDFFGDMDPLKFTSSYPTPIWPYCILRIGTSLTPLETKETNFAFLVKWIHIKFHLKWSHF